MTRKETIKIAGKDFDITPLPPAKADPWREKVRAELGKVLVSGDEGNEFKLSTQQVIELACKAPHITRELFFEYAPNVAKERDFIMNHGDDEELIDGFVIAVRFAFPLGKLLSLAKNGFNTPATSTN